MSALFRQETDTFRSVADAQQLHVLDKRVGQALTYVMADQSQGPTEELYGKPSPLPREQFEELWSRAEAEGLRVERVISGGQTGADRGGLDAALDLEIPIGGSCPKGRKAEDGAIPARYPLTETGSASYMIRTRRNADEADATLIFVDGGMSGGSLMTVEYLRMRKKPHLVVNLDQWAKENDRIMLTGRVRNWLVAGRYRVVNVAGSRESKAPGIQERVHLFMREVLAP